MPTSVYFNNQAATREQFLIEDMIIESIRNHGIDVLYIPRDSQSSIDELFGDDPVKSFTQAFKIDMYLESSNDFEGNQEFFSKFGLEIQKSGRIAVARRTFDKYVGSVRNVPKEGDLIWMPIQQKLMEIKFVEEEKNFFQAGKVAPYMYGLNIEAFRYNGELLNTGYAEIDNIGDARAFGVDYNVAAGGSGTFRVHEIVYQGASLAAATAKGYVSDWNKSTRILRLRNVKGVFATGSNIIGEISEASWNLSSANKMDDATTTFDDNYRIESEADNVLDWSETNPFGTPNE